MVMGAAMQLAATEEAEEMVREEALHTFWSNGNPFFEVHLTSWMVTFWIIMALIVVLSIFATRKAKLKPTGFQNFAEWSVENLTRFFGLVVGKEYERTFAPLFVTFFVFILFSNYAGLLPMAGKFWGYAVPTSYINVTVGFALITFVLIHAWGIRANGVHYVKHFFSPFAFLFPILILEELVKPVALAMRLYGNIFGEEQVVSNLANIIPALHGFGLPVLMQILGTLFGLIQALVFTLLSAIYISTAMGEAH